MASALSAVLGSTPPQRVPIPQRVGGSLPKRTSTIVSFKSSEEAGSLRSQKSSWMETGMGSLSLGRSLSAQDGSASAGVHTPAAPLAPQGSIPKAASFVKIQGFETSARGSPTASPPTSPQPARSSLLSRQISSDCLAPLAAPRAEAPAATALDLAARLERTLASAAPVRPTPHRAAAPSAAPPADLLDRLRRTHAVFDEPLVQRAFNIARGAHDGQYRADGQPVFAHCVEVARVLAELGADAPCCAAALLHDALSSSGLRAAQLRPMLAADDAADLVEQACHLGDLAALYRSAGNTAQAAPLVGLMVAAAADQRALLVRLAAAVADVRALGAPPGPQRAELAREALALWAPLANRLGVWALKSELEDGAFRALMPAQYAELRGRLEEAQAPATLASLVDSLRGELQRQDVQHLDLSGRPKNLWGVASKMSAKGYTLGQISDVRGLRVIVTSKEDCYRALRAVERLWAPVAPAKDYVRSPKANGYQSLHVVVDAGDGHHLEVQIRTAKMHFFAEYGSDAAHWQYKEASKQDAAGVTAAAPPAAGSSPPGSASSAAREAAWAKLQVSRQLAADRKCRPSGSPTGDNSLAGIVGLSSIDELSPTDGSLDSIPSAPGASYEPDARFQSYLERSGQVPAPPTGTLRTTVAVVAAGALRVIDLPPAATLADVVDLLGGPVHPAAVRVRLNRDPAPSPSTELRTGDLVEVWAEPSALPPPRRPAQPGQQRNNLLPLPGGLLAARRSQPAGAGTAGSH